MVSTALFRLLAILLLVAANAFFVAAEFALVSVRDTRVQQLIDAHRIGARIVQRLHRNLDELLSAVQFGVTLASLGLGWIGEPTLATLIEPTLTGLPHSRIFAHALAATLAFCAIAYLHITLGELVPKAVALQRAERVALAVAAPMDVFVRLARPALYLLSGSAALALKVFGLRLVREGGGHSAEELKLVVTASRRMGMLEKQEAEIIQRALELRHLTVREIMVPRRDVFSLPADLGLEEAAAQVAAGRRSRIPVYDPQRGGPEHIVGVLYARELARWMVGRRGQPAGGEGARQVRHLMRAVLVVPETKPLPDLLEEFRQRRRHLAVVVDEFGSTAGVVTVEDLLEQVVGRLEDEFDGAGPLPAKPAGALALDGSTTVRDLETQYRIPLPREQGFETLGGFVMAMLQKVPEAGDAFEYRGQRFTVEQMEGHRIARVRIEAAPVAGPGPA